MHQTAIFLDVDGVLNCRSTKERIGPDGEDVFTSGGYKGIEDSKVLILKEIADAVDGELILTSTWKLSWKIPGDREKRYLDRKLGKAGLRIIGATEDSGFDRGRGIRKYLEDHPYRYILILDDEVFDYKGMNLMKYLVRTRSFDRGNGAGLLPKHVRLSVKVVEKQK